MNSTRNFFRITYHGIYFHHYCFVIILHSKLYNIDGYLEKKNLELHNVIKQFESVLLISFLIIGNYFLVRLTSTRLFVVSLVKTLNVNSQKDLFEIRSQRQLLFLLLLLNTSCDFSMMYSFSYAILEPKVIEISNSFFRFMTSKCLDHPKEIKIVI